MSDTIAPTKKQVRQDSPDLIDFSTISTEEAVRRLESSDHGLPQAEAARRLKIYGPNLLPEAEQKPAWLIFLKQFKSLLVLILLLAAFLSYLTSHVIDVYIILAVVLANALIGFIQEWRAEKAVLSLRKILRPTAKVFRDGELQIVSGADLVPGDIIQLEEGDNVPADARIIDARSVRAMEAALTGESLPVSKTSDMMAPTSALGDKRNMLWKGTFLGGGHARALVVHTGTATALGRIAADLHGIGHEKSHFQTKIDKLATQMGIASVAGAVLLFAISWYTTGLPFAELLLVAVAAMVAIIPEGLPAIIAIVLAIGARRMTKRNAIVREFTSTETLGAVTTIITDKTGTVTENALTVRKIMVHPDIIFDVTGEGWSPAGNFFQHGVVTDPGAHPVLQKLLNIAAYSNNASLRHVPEKDTYELIGDPTEGALLALARKGGIDPAGEEHIRRHDDLPFNATLKLRATLVKEGNKNYLLVVGAPEKILALSTGVASAERSHEMDARTFDSIRTVIEAWSSQSMRVIGLAYKEYDGEEIDEDTIRGLVFTGLTGMLDPPRPEAKEAVRHCRRAGIRVIMATGDHISTAVSIARSVGIIDSTDDSTILALTGDQLHAMDEKEFDQAIRQVNVFSRLNPDMKFRIASRLQHMGHLIAMTGDGVNDAPALKKADVGIAMGIMGTDVARDAAKVVLADDNFSTIVSAIEEGRIIFKNARQASFYLITTNLAEITTLLGAVVLAMPIPLTAIQILWLNLVTDGIGDMALASERGHGDALEEKPRHKDEALLNKSILPFLIINVIIMAGLSIAAFRYFLPMGVDSARSAVFIVMTFTQLFNLYNMRSLTKSIFSIGLFTNIYVTITVVSSTIITALIIELPFLKELFGFGPMPAAGFITLALLSSAVLGAGEVYKYFTTGQRKTS